MPRNKWFEVDKEGLAKILERKGGKAFAIFELVQNAWDQNVKTVDISFFKKSNLPTAVLSVIDDDPEGFKNLEDAFTLFAESNKKGNPEQRGRFNLGEKLVLAICKSAHIKTTKGAVLFSDKGHRTITRERRLTGSEFYAVLKITNSEVQELEELIFTLIPPQNIETRYNGNLLPQRKPIAEFECQLATEIADEDGRLRPTKRKTQVEIYEPLNGETAHIYEMGIPVVETFDRFHVNIMQKVPLSLDRDNVPPSYLKEIRAQVLSHTFTLLKEEEVNENWIDGALANPNCSKEAVKFIIDTRFGENAVAYDPSDPEGSKLSMSDGRSVVHGRTFSKEAWENIREAGILRPAGQVTPSPKPYSAFGEKLKTIPQEEWTDGMNRVAKYAKQISHILFGYSVPVVIANDRNLDAAATYGNHSELVLNVAKLRHSFFDHFPDNMEKVTDLLIHEFGHEYSSDHLSADYYNALTKIGAKLVMTALECPNIFK